MDNFDIINARLIIQNAHVFNIIPPFRYIFLRHDVKRNVFVLYIHTERELSDDEQEVCDDIWVGAESYGSLPNSLEINIIVDSSEDISYPNEGYPKEDYIAVYGRFEKWMS